MTTSAQSCVPAATTLAADCLVPPGSARGPDGRRPASQASPLPQKKKWKGGRPRNDLANEKRRIVTLTPWAMDVHDIAAVVHAFSEPDMPELMASVRRLSRLLSSALGDGAEHLVGAIRDTGLVGPLVHILRLHRENAELLHMGLSILVNLADMEIGGSDIVVVNHGGDLLLELVSSPVESVAYYAVAGVQNVRAARRRAPAAGLSLTPTPPRSCRPALLPRGVHQPHPGRAGG